MGGLEIVLRLLGITADIVTIVVVVINICVFLKSKKYFADSEYDCSINYFYEYEDIPKIFKISEGGEEYLNCTIFYLNDKDNIGVDYTIFHPKKSAVLKKVNIYVIDLHSIGNDSISKKKNFRKVQYYRTIKKTLCVNLSPGDVLPGFLVEWKDYHGKHSYFSNTQEVRNQFDRDIVYWWGEEY